MPSSTRPTFVKPVDVGAYIPRVMPPWWHLDVQRTVDGGEYFRSKYGLAVLMGAEMFSDGSVWLHVSLSRRSRLPDWQDVREVKDVFVGDDRAAVQVLPSKAEYVNHNPHVLHMWSPVHGSQLPDFRRDGRWVKNTL